MSLAQKTKTTLNWQPTATFSTLRERAHILSLIRQFFAERLILEVDTPLLSQYTVTDPYIESFRFEPTQPNALKKCHYLQTSPEYAMKRLLAAGSGPIFQICKAFRQEESGKLHNPEFTLLEWYRPGFNHHDLMDEIEQFIQTIFQTDTPPVERITYAQLFQEKLNIDPHKASLDTLKNKLIEKKIELNAEITSFDKDTCLQLLLSHCIEPTLGFDAPVFVYDFPATQAALAKIRQENPPVAERFELYMQGLEIANGFHELNHAEEQRQRFENNQQQRQKVGLSIPEIDEHFISALSHGMPDCAGVALGIDRLLMLAMKKSAIREVISFDWINA